MKHVCERCSDLGKDCCHLRGDPDYKFGMTLSDILRISKSTGLDPEKFADLEEIPAAALREIKKLFPNMARMFPNGKRIALKFSGPNKACIFWEKNKGCSMDRMTRPRTCSLYPAWYTDTSIHFNALSTRDTCMAIAESTEKRHALKVIQQDENVLKDIVDLSDKELEFHSKQNVETIENHFYKKGLT